jgi:Mg2+-importing ATPase
MKRTSPDEGLEERLPPKRSRRWLWLLGLALVGAVIAVSLELSRPRELLDLLAQAEPLWLLLALLLQGLTYFAEGENWRVVVRAAGVPISPLLTFRLALAKLFVDQAIPSAGLSGTVVIARALSQRHVPTPVVTSAVVIDLTSYYFAYIAALGVALVIALASGRASPLVLTLGALVIVAGTLIVAAVLAVAARSVPRLERLTRRVPLLRDALRLLAKADPRLTHRVRLHLFATLWQLVTILCDALSMWLLLRALGVHASLPLVFASFMGASVLRTVSVLPAGLGPFEAASVATLTLADVPVTAALSATLLFRVLTLLLPLIPGMLLARSALMRDPPEG